MAIKLAILGVGRIGVFHIDNISKMRDEFEIVAIADPYTKNLDEISKKYGIPFYSNNIDDAIALDNVEAVLIATSTDTHAEISIKAAKAGKHIFCEKPIDTDVERIKNVVEEVKKAGVKFQTGFNRRFDHNFLRVRELVEEGKVGEPHYVKISSRDPEPPNAEYVKVSGGIFLDMMIHDFDMARYLTGSEVVEVYATGSVLIDPLIGEAGDVDTAAVTLKFANGALCHIDNSRQAVYGYDQRVEVFGSKGQAVAYNDTPSTVELFTEEGIKKDKIPYFFLDRYVGAFMTQYQEFYDCITEDRNAIVDEVDGLKSVEIALAATESFRTNKPVKL